MRLAVVTTNTAAIHCYVRRGFTACGTAPEAIHADGHYYDEILMAKLLAGDDAENDREVASAGHIRANWH
jgi:RimJ/RimL family protein N-acetyltransferase